MGGGGGFTTGERVFVDEVEGRNAARHPSLDRFVMRESGIRTASLHWWTLQKGLVIARSARRHLHCTFGVGLICNGGAKCTLSTSRSETSTSSNLPLHI